MTVEERVQELLSNDEVLEKMLFAENPDALIQIFTDNNIALEGVTKEEAFEAFQSARTGELREEDLNAVAGGGFYFMMSLKAGAIAASGATVGGVLCLVGGVAVIGLATYAGYRLIKKYI